MKQYFDSAHYIPVTQHEADDDSIYDILQVVKLQYNPDLDYIYSFNRLTEHISCSYILIVYWKVPIGGTVSYVSQYDEFNHVLYISRNQFLLNTCYEVE